MSETHTPSQIKRAKEVLSRLDKKDAEIIRWCFFNAGMFVSEDDALIQAFLITHNIPDKTQWAKPIDGGYGTAAFYCDGIHSYVIAGYSGHEDESANGYALARIDTPALVIKELAESGHATMVAKTMAKLMGLNPETLKNLHQKDFIKPANQ